MESLFIHLIAGAIGGTLAGILFKDIGFGPLRNMIVGIGGGVLVGEMLNVFDLGSPASNPGSSTAGTLVSQIAGGIVGGGVLVAIAGLVRSLTRR